VSDPLAVLARVAPGAWLVGGAPRDRLLGRPTSDFDVVLAPGVPVDEVARALGRDGGGFTFSLSEAFGAWRVVAHDRSWQLDLGPLAGDTIEADLGRRDLTVNALAEPIGTAGGLVDPFGGQRDLGDRRLRMVTPRAFGEDPLRTMRLARLACELGFEIEPATLRSAREAAADLGGVAPERVFAELRRILVADRALEGLDAMDATGVTGVVLPELNALRGIEQSRFHHLDVHDHTRVVLAEAIALEHDPEPVFGPHAAALSEALSAPLANELTRWQALRFGAILHDIAKPQTRAVTETGRVTFMGHDEAGAAASTAILGRLRASERLTAHVAGLARHHLRLGFLVHEMPLSRRAVYRYLDACGPVALDVTVLSVADRLATRGENSARAIARHLELARQMVAEALTWVTDPPRPPVRGDELAHALGVKPGPVIGDLLHELEEASFAGEVAGRAEAIEHARRLLQRAGAER
jgi:tRNA nucleotidyltransferase/poly(A) polymerase